MLRTLGDRSDDGIPIASTERISNNSSDDRAYMQSGHRSAGSCDNGRVQSPSRLPHMVRGSIAAGVATFVALFSHVVGGGDTPGPVGIVVPLLLSLTVCILLAGRKLSIVRLSVSVAVSQTLFHTLFVLGTPVSDGRMSAASGHQHSHVLLPGSLFSEQTAALAHGHTAMWVSHLIGAIATVLFLYQGEQTIHRLLSLAERVVVWLRHRLRAPRRLSVTTPWAPASVPVETNARTVLLQLHVSTLSRRGPPRAFRIAQ